MTRSTTSCSLSPTGPGSVVIVIIPRFTPRHSYHWNPRPMHTHANAFNQIFSGLLRPASRPYRLALSCAALALLLAGCGPGRSDAAHAAIPAAPAVAAAVLKVAPQRVPIAV